ncbi:hypothetical protein SUGI_1199150 [Cryptomeria japonica]|nr:hypothetical protein SUGI_1199150 [Cryptomeria japonica]
MAMPDEGFVCSGKSWLHVSEFTPPLRPFLLWSANCNKEVCRASAQIGMNGIKDFLRTRNAQAIKAELAKWGPYVEQPPSVAEVSPKHRRERRKGSTKTKSIQALVKGESSCHNIVAKRIDSLDIRADLFDVKGKSVREAS